MASMLDKPLQDIVNDNRAQRKMQRKVFPDGGGPERAYNRNNSAFKQESKPFLKVKSPKPQQPSILSAKLMVSNLHPRVNDNDIKELFGQVGQVKKAVVHYNPKGVSLGTAEVIYGKPGEAAEAVKKYNNLSLDGRPMKLFAVQDPRSDVLSRITPVQNTPKGSSPNKPKAEAGNLERKGSAKKQGKAIRPAQQTQKQLDRDLDQYHQAA